MNSFICKDCYPDFEDIGLLISTKGEISSFYLVHDIANDKYWIADCDGQGHKDTLLFKFKTKPEADPIIESGLLDEEISDNDLLIDKSHKWIRKHEIHPKMCMHTGWKLLMACIDSGYTRKEFGDPIFFLIHKAGKLIEQ